MMKWLRPLLRRSAVEREMDAEMRFHFERLMESFRAQGMSPEEARRRARLEFGGMGQLKDDAREARIAGVADRLWRELRNAVRSLTRSPGFSLVAVATLALGIGANTAMFSLLDQAILRDLPVKHPERLVVFHSAGVNPGMDRGSDRKLSFSYPKYVDFRDHADVFEGVAARFGTSGGLQYGGVTERVSIEAVTGNFFDVLGIRAAAGRLLTPADDRTSMGHPVAVLGYSYWRKRFGGDPSIVGQKVALNGMPMTVVGVSAAGFHSVDRGNDDDVHVPMMMKDVFTPSWRGLNNPFWAWLQIVARVKPGLSLRQAEIGANVQYRQILEDESKQLSGPWVGQRDEFVSRHLDLWPASGGIVDKMDGQKTFLLELTAMTGIVLLIACVNLASLLLARTTSRNRELAIRLALGAGRLGVIRQLALENLSLAAAGGLAGVLLASYAEVRAARFLISPDAGDLFRAAPDLRILLFALAATVVTALALAVAPVLQIRRAQLAGVLQTETRASASRGQVWFRKAMVAAQLAFCVWLMIGAGLFSRSLARLRSVDLGFRKENLITFSLDPSLSGFKPDVTRAMYLRVEEVLGALPGVSSVADSDYGMMGGGINVERLDIDGFQPQKPSDTNVCELIVTPGYLRTLGMTLLSGRDFVPADTQPVHTAIVNQAFAKRYFHGQSPIGRHFRSAFDKRQDREIVGLVKNQAYFGPDGHIQPMYYLPFQVDGPVSFYVRTATQPEGLVATVRRIVEQQAPGVPIFRLRTMEEHVDLALGSKKQVTMLAAFFGLLATVLAAIGLYGVMAYTVSRRTREIGIRMALGAGKADVLGMVVREVGLIIALGLVAGVPTGLALARLVRSQLFDISPQDPVAIAVAAAVVAAVALLSGLMPARRATTVDPVTALRWE